MFVVKRNGRKENVSFDKIISRVRLLSEGLDVDPALVGQKVTSRIYSGVKTTELDDLASQLCTSMVTKSLDYGILANRIVISNHHKCTSPSFSETIYQLYNCENPLITKEVYEITMAHKEKLNSVIDQSSDYLLDFFGFKTLERAYLMRNKHKIIERPSHLFMRVSLGLHGWDIKSAVESYEYMSKKYFTHATPTLFHAGTNHPQLLSCFLLGTGDSVEGMYKTIGDCAKISKWAGGIGVHITNIRSKGSYIRGNNGRSNGIIPMLRVYNNTARHIDQAGKRNGSIAIYLEPWHPDVMEFLDLRKNQGVEEERCRDLFLALWIPDIFMEKVEYSLRHPDKDIEWCLFDPDECPRLRETYGDEFRTLYEKYRAEGKAKKTVSVDKIWKKILASHVETGTPYMLFKDQINKVSNQKNIGIINSSNLCSEIVEYSDDKEYACCCLSSISLPSFVQEKKIKGPVTIYTKSNCPWCVKAKKLLPHYTEINLDDDVLRHKYYEKWDVNTVPQIFFGEERIGGFTELKKWLQPTYNFSELEKVSRVVVRNLNKVVDKNYYPVPETRLSNFKHRPLGVGIQGLADVFFKMRIPFDSQEARELNVRIFEHIQFACYEASMELAKEREEYLEQEKVAPRDNRDGYTDLVYMGHHQFTEAELSLTKFRGAYLTFEGSPLSEGKFSWDLWGVEPKHIGKERIEELRQNILRYGVRNSLLTALMPTASTSQVLGNNECFEPITSNIYTRRTLAGDFIVVNKYLMTDLEREGLWSQDMKDLIIANDGSIQDIEGIPQEIKDLYKTAYEIKQKVILDLSADRSPFICQTQSMNLFFEEPSQSILSSAFIYGWKRKLKTGSYYIRNRPKAKAQQFTIDPKLLKTLQRKSVAFNQEPEICESCSG